jgi:uncharacterized membrane protein
LRNTFYKPFRKRGSRCVLGAYPLADQDDEEVRVGRDGEPCGRTPRRACPGGGVRPVGVSFLFGKWALEEMGPAHVTFLRFALASAALLPYALLRGVWPGRRDLPLFLLVGFLTLPATFLVQFWGLSLTGATVAALIVGCAPPMVAFFARLFLGERLGKIGWTAVGASTLGVALAVARPGASNN